MRNILASSADAQEWAITFFALSPTLKSGARILLVLLGGWIGVRLIVFLLEQKERIMIASRGPMETVPGAAEKRIQTLIHLLAAAARVGIWGFVIITILDQVGINMTPLITSAGIIGLAIGFGAQSLIADVISGLFIIMENQIRVGDMAVVNKTSGLVEAITFRTVVLRDVAGAVHIFRHGAITTLSNRTKEWSAYVIDVGVSYEEDTDHVTDVMRQVAEEMRQESKYHKKILEPIEIFGVDDFGPYAVTIKARIKTLPMEQWEVGREYRRRLKKAFDHHGIKISSPHRTPDVGEGTFPTQTP